MKPSFAVAGDPIRDVFLLGEFSGERFNVREQIVRFGGATNTYSNAAVIAQKNQLGCTPLWNSDYYDVRALTRLIDESNGKTIEYWDLPVEAHPRMYARAHEGTPPFHYYAHEFRGHLPNVLIASEYNKGSLSTEQDERWSTHGSHYTIVVVDSRYRTVHPSVFEDAAVRIWHCTGSEYDEDFAKKFDLIAWTNGAKPVKLGMVRNGSIEWINPLSEDIHIVVVDELGAGDTYTAALAVYFSMLYFQQLEEDSRYPDLSVNYEKLFEHFRTASTLAEVCARDVITRRFTSVVDKSIIPVLI